MSILLTVLLIIAAILVTLLVVAFFIRKNHSAKREITINAPIQKVFDYIKFLEN